MAETMTFELVSPAKKLASAEAEAVTIPGMEGDLTAMANHAPFLTTLRPGVVTVRNGSSEERYVVTGGFAEISDNTVSVLAEQAVEGAAADTAWLDERIAEAEKALEEASEDRKQAARQRVDDFQAVRAAI
ncbi:MAG: F0F1 ATP synthase subunit epsilon [Pseudomonadota bacterium]